MKANVLRRVSVLGGCAWLGVAAYGISTAMTESGDGWRVGYALFTVALLLGAASTVLIVAVASRHGNRPRLRMAGLVVSGLGCGVAAVGAWALPVWMTLLGVGFALVGVAAGSVRRRLLGVLAAAQLMAIAVLIAGIEAEVGPRDEWGDYPAAGGIALVVMASITLAAIVTLTRNADRFGNLPSPSQATA
jgi:MFS family permease